MALTFADPSSETIPLHVVSQDGFDDWAQTQSQTVQTWLTAQGFKGAIGQATTLPDAAGRITLALAGYGTAAHAAALTNLGITCEHRRIFRPVRQFMSQEDAVEY